MWLKPVKIVILLMTPWKFLFFITVFSPSKTDKASGTLFKLQVDDWSENILHEFLSKISSETSHTHQNFSSTFCRKKHNILWHLAANMSIAMQIMT